MATKTAMADDIKSAIGVSLVECFRQEKDTNLWREAASEGIGNRLVAE